VTFSVFPTDGLFDPETEVWNLRGRVIGGGISVGGSTTLTRTDGGGLWVCQMTGIELYTKAQLLAASALDMQLEGGSSSIVVPCFSFPLRPVPAGVDWTPSIALTDAADLRATTLSLVITTGAPLVGGEPFSITGEVHGKRFYKVHSVDAAGVVDGVTTQTIRIRPPLREAAADGVALDFHDVGCVMRLANPEAWLSPLDAAHEQVAQPVWIEHFDRPGEEGA
jgi:hypothetical protein